MPHRTHHHAHRVTYAECTVGNHVYHARYLDLLEAARGALFRDLGLPFLQLQDQAVIFPVIDCHLRFRAPARYDDPIDIATWLLHLHRVRLAFRYQIRLESGALLLEAQTTHACTDLDGKPRRIPEKLEVLLRPYLEDTPPAQ